MHPSDNGLVPTFKTITTPNEAKSLKEGRPIFDEMEVCEIRFAGDRNKVSVFPANDVCTNPDGGSDQITYAQRFPDQYKRFKDNNQQTLSGTPLTELTFLSEAKRAELRALNIHTAEQLSSLDGTPLKQLGMGGRAMKDQATTYLQHASQNAEPAAQAARIADLEERLRIAEGGKATDLSKEPEIEESEPTKDKAIEDCTDDELRAFIEKETGHAPHGNMSREKLVTRATKLASGD